VPYTQTKINDIEQGNSAKTRPFSFRGRHIKQNGQRNR